MDYPKLGGDDRFQPADFLVGRYIAKVPAGTTLADVLHPQYFESHLNRLRPLMEISVISDDAALDARIRVLTVMKTTAKCRVLDVYAGAELDADAPKMDPSSPFVEWGGPNHKWRIRHGDKIVETGYTTKEEAQTATDAFTASING